MSTPSTPVKYSEYRSMAFIREFTLLDGNTCISTPLLRVRRLVNVKTLFDATAKGGGCFRALRRSSSIIRSTPEYGVL
jgi:hypothetical protein